MGGPVGELRSPGPPGTGSPLLGAGRTARTDEEVRVRYPDWDPRSWSEPYRDPPTRPEVRRVPGHWVEDPRERSGWRWDPAAPDADDSPTMIRNVREPAMTSLESDRPDASHAGLVAYDPDDPVEYAPPQDLDQPSFEQPGGFERPGGGELVDPVMPDIAVCPTCGTAVARDRLRV